MNLTAVIAIADDGAIGFNGRLPWENISEDMKHFRKVTTGHAVIMGRKTYESIGKPLPNRRNIVVSGPYQPFNLNPPSGIEVARHPLEAVRMAWETDVNPIVMGGGSIYSALWNLCSHLILTEVHQKFARVGYQIFNFDRTWWREIDRRAGETSGIEFVTFDRGEPKIRIRSGHAPICTGQLVHSEFESCPVHDRSRT